jgi:putative FmdB family regulatory protein
MPIYAYRCSACGHAQDVLQKMSDPLLTVCPACGQATYAKQVTAAGFQLKGSGWYVTDFRDGNKPPAVPPVKTGDKPADASSDKGSEKGSEKGSDKGSDKSAAAPAPASDKSSGSASDKSAGKSADKPAATPPPAASTS